MLTCCLPANHTLKFTMQCLRNPVLLTRSHPLSRSLAPIKTQRATCIRHQLPCLSSNSSDRLLSAPQEVSVSLPSSECQPRASNFLSALSKAGFLVGLAAIVALTNASSALAANTAGRTGGQSFSSRRSNASQQQPRSITRASSHHTTVIHTGPSFGFGWGMPSFFYPVMPFGGYYGTGGSPLVTVLLIAVVGLMAVQVFRMFQTKGTSSASGDEDDDESFADEPVTVARVQVGLLAVAKDVKSELDLLAVRADTSTPEGLYLILQETVLALMRNPQYCVFGSSTSKTVSDADDAERLFQTMSMEERSKFKEETLVNVGGINKKSQMTSEGSSDGTAELITVTLMIAAEGEFELPAVRNLSDLKLVLSKIGGTPASNLLATELMWTPQAEGDVMSQEDCLSMYPNLVPL